MVNERNIFAIKNNPRTGFTLFRFRSNLLLCPVHSMACLHQRPVLAEFLGSAANDFSPRRVTQVTASNVHPVKVFRLAPGGFLQLRSEQLRSRPLSLQMERIRTA